MAEAKQEASSDATVAELESTLGGLGERWEAYALSGLGVYSPPEAQGDRLEVAADAALPTWRGLALVTHACIPSFLDLQERLVARSCSRTWLRACERGPAKALWLTTLGGAGMLGTAAAAAAEGDHLATCYARHRFMAGGSAAKVFKVGKLQHGDVRASGRVKAKSPVVPLGDGTAAALSDLAPPTLTPDLALVIYDMSALAPLGHVPITGAKHGKSLQRPVVITSVQAARVASASSSQACVAAIHRLVVVFSWRLGGAAEGEAGAVGVREPSVGEVRWGEGGKEVLRSAAFVGFGAEAPVAVLMEAGRNGPAVEVYHRVGCDTAPAPPSGVTPPPSIARYVLREVVPLSQSKPAGGLIPGALYGGTVALWAKVGERAIDFVRIRPVSAADDGDAAAGGKGSAGALFARARQSARKGTLRVHEEAGAGLDMEASKWGYLVEAVDEEPGQPDVKKGDCIIAIGGQALHGLDEEVMNWRFGRNFAEGAEILVLPADLMSTVLAAEASAASGKPDKRLEAAAVAVHTAEVSKRQRFVFSARLEAWCVASTRDPPRMLAVIDNRLVMADLCDDGAMTREALSGLAKAPWKRPVEHVSLLHDASDVVLAGVAQGVLVWRVPIVAGGNGQPELLASVASPARCTIVGLSFGLGFSMAGAWAWVAADLSGAGADTGGAFDTWQVFTGRQRPALQAAAERGGRGPGLAGDAVSRAFASVGACSDAVLAAAKAAVASAAGQGSQALKSWVPKLRQERMEPLYAAVDRAEPICAEAVRDLRRWQRAEGRQATPVRQDGAKGLLAWIEDFRRYAIWPLQVAFQADGDESDGEDLPTRQSMAANARGTGAAAGTVPRGAQ